MDSAPTINTPDDVTPAFNLNQWLLKGPSSHLYPTYDSTSLISLNSPFITSTQFLQATGPLSDLPNTKITLKFLKENAPNVFKIVILAKNQIVGPTFTTEEGAWIEDVTRSGSLAAETLGETWDLHIQHQEGLPVEEREYLEDGYHKTDKRLIKLVGYYS